MVALARLLNEAEKRKARKAQSKPGGLIEFVRYFWHVLEPQTPLVEGWALEAVCTHLEAVTFGDITRLLINVPPGFMKSLLTDVFWPAWEWGPMGLPNLRYVAFSYAAGLTERDNGKFRDLLLSRDYQDLWGGAFKLRKIGEVKVTNDKTGSKLATSVEGIGTGERGDRVIVDDPHNVKEGESDRVRSETVRWFRESIQNRLNDMENSAIVVIMQRVHETDVSGTILADMSDYVHLMIPMEFDVGRKCVTDIGWSDPRTEDGELAWHQRFPEAVVDQLRSSLGPYAYAGQYQQAPQPRGGGIFKHEWWGWWESETEGNKFPPMDYVVASADTAYTKDQDNDPTGFTVWGVWHEQNVPKIMLMYAWRKHLELHGPYIERLPGEIYEAYYKRASPSWGLVEWMAHDCRKFEVDKLLIESKASGISVAQELRRLYGTEGWGIQLEQVHGDKVARAYAAQPLFSQGLVYAPAPQRSETRYAWADLVIEEMGSFPRGRYKDLTDSATQALKHIREAGLILHRHERDYEHDQLMRARPVKTAPLYPGAR